MSSPLDFSGSADLLKAGNKPPSGDDPLWSPHESPFIRWLIEQWTAKGMNRFGALQAELAQWLDFTQHKVGPALPKPAASEFAQWTPGELKLAKAYLEALPPEAFELSDWLLVSDYLFQRYCPLDVMRADAQLLAVRANTMGQIAAQYKIISAEKAAGIVRAAPTTVLDALAREPGMSAAQRAALEFGNARCCENVVALTDSARAGMRKLIVDYQEQVMLGGGKAPREALQTRLFDQFGTLNRNWRRIAITEAGENMNQGMIASLQPGAKVQRIEQYRGACPFCIKWDGKVFDVVAADAPKKNWQTQIWPGKNNLGRSSSPRKKTPLGLVDRTEEELWAPAAGLFHPNCRGRWRVLPGSPKGGELRKSKALIDWNEAQHPRNPDGTFGEGGKIAGMEKRYLSKEAACKFYQAAISDRSVEKKAPLGRLTNVSAISAAIGKDVALDEVILQASYLAHVHDFHGPGGFRKDVNPIVAEDMPMAILVINGDKSPEFTGKLSCAEQPLVKFAMTINGITYKVIGEVRPGRRNRNIAVYNFYKR